MALKSIGFGVFIIIPIGAIFATCTDAYKIYMAEQRGEECMYIFGELFCAQKPNKVCSVCPKCIDCWDWEEPHKAPIEYKAPEEVVFDNKPNNITPLVFDTPSNTVLHERVIPNNSNHHYVAPPITSNSVPKASTSEISITTIEHSPRMFPDAEHHSM